MSVRFAIEPLAKAHKRDDFTCGNDRIDSYFRETVSQDVKRKYATCFVAREIATDRVAGFYTLSSSNVPLTEVPEPLAKRLPRYPTVPAVLIGWLGRHSDYAGQGLGEALLFDAIKTVADSPDRRPRHLRRRDRRPGGGLLCGLRLRALGAAATHPLSAGGDGAELVIAMTTASAPTLFQPRAAARKSFCAMVRGGFQRRKRLFFQGVRFGDSGAMARLRKERPPDRIRAA